jgi:hypothetical protein
MSEEFEHILDECIDRLLRGESLEQCLQRYPEQAAQLEPLLRVVLATQKASSVEPRAEFKAGARYQIHSILYAEKQKPKTKRLPLLGWVPRWAVIVASVVLVILVAGGGTVAAASDSLPGETLYPVKLATERVQLAFTFSDVGKAKLHAKFAGRRVEEMARIVERGDLERVEGLLSRFNAHLRNIEGWAAKVKQGEPGDEAQVTELRELLWRNAARDAAILRMAERRAPERARSVIELARGRLNESYERLLSLLNENLDTTPNF